MFLEKHGTAKFPMEEVTGLDQALLPAVQRLIDDGYLFAHRFYSTAYVTQAGLRAYQEETLRRKDRLEQQKQEEAGKNAERASDRAYADKNAKKQFRHDWRIAVFNLLGGFVLGATVNHFVDIVGYAAWLWRSFSEWFQSFHPQ